MTDGEQANGSLPPPVSTRHQIALYLQRRTYDGRSRRYPFRHQIPCICTTLIAYLSAVSRSALTTETHQVYSSAPLWLSPSRTVAPSWTYTLICISTKRVTRPLTVHTSGDEPECFFLTWIKQNHEKDDIKLR